VFWHQKRDIVLGIYSIDNELGENYNKINNLIPFKDLFIDWKSPK
jgi:hypothetical protein